MTAGFGARVSACCCCPGLSLMLVLLEQVDWKDERREGGGRKSTPRAFSPLERPVAHSCRRGQALDHRPQMSPRRRGDQQGISAGVNAGVVWAGLTLHNSGHCAREARQPREQGRNYAVPAFLSSCELLRARSRRFRGSQPIIQSFNS